MREITLMNPSKVTDKKLRWSKDVDGVEFKLYIPQSRVPRPWPKRIHVVVLELSGGSDESTSTRKAPEEPISCVVEKVPEHTETVMYRPIGDPKYWGLGEPYIPFAMLSDVVPGRVRVEVQWDHSAGTWPE